MVNNMAIIGSSGALGRAFTQLLSTSHPTGMIHTFSRTQPEESASNIIRHLIEYDNEASIEKAARLASKEAPLDMVIVATGMLHDTELMPEKSLKELSAEKFQRLFAVNTILPALMVKHFSPTLNRHSPSLLGILSARVGSISHNQLGGWYAYRASKAALNMIIKNAAIEIGRQNKQAIMVGLHPGTVNSNLSKPFQGNVHDGKLFTPQFSAAKLLEVLTNLTPQDSGKCFAWDGKEIEP
jgi:NAD(P)-dependent dehydrogenase (short-subunit alcohol dehydrogenase family)